MCTKLMRINKKSEIVCVPTPSTVFLHEIMIFSVDHMDLL